MELYQALVGLYPIVEPQCQYLQRWPVPGPLLLMPVQELRQEHQRHYAHAVSLYHPMDSKSKGVVPRQCLLPARLRMTQMTQTM
jgi:hypothetical protein